ncbi:phosphatidate cytidylyltransferase [Terricaulis silvestris]|uniref:Phosphatidate cytidylyltransferase n=1 Tax=Terricaulis silvestris TaxID=2686094 RepID=A0A6I6MT00_9CAUL|nr:phosphatidate cytidylyltransferase [Terricaulis silvestris]QGZ95907.1 Phosphatidate cytidylyltransferase [Terricaulis silvestris]
MFSNTTSLVVVAPGVLPLLFGFAVVLALLVLGSIAALILPRMQPGKWTDLAPRMQSWWIIVILVAGALVLGWQATAILFALISFLALKEYLTLAPTRKEDRLIVLLAYLSVFVNYGLIFATTTFEDSYQVYLVFIPVYGFLIAAAAMAWIGRTEGYLATVGIVHWGMVVCVYNIGYIAFLMRVPDAEAPAGGAGLVFFLIFITQLNDVAQYCWGKAFGKTKITPTVSPNKTWEGAIGGWLTTAVVFYVLAPYFTPLTPTHAAIMGVIMPMAGFFGDITMSAVKRDLGVKDTSRLIPGHGGVLDRLDSLTFAAPVYFHLLAYFAIERF